jgi:hypothetical protein
MSWEKRAHFFGWWPSQQGYPSGMTIPIVEVSGSKFAAQGATESSSYMLHV